MKKYIRKDGHVHTPFCPHGSQDALEAYVEEGIRLGLEEISFTEHFPLPKGIADPEFERECAILEEEIQPYFEAVENVRQKYGNMIKINKGFEVDYIEGKEEEIKKLLNRYGQAIEDSILSVHFIYYQGEYYSIDCEPEMERLLEKLPDLQAIYDLYFQTVLKSVQADLGYYKPKRIGHPTLIYIFQKKWPVIYDDKGKFEEIAQAIYENGYEVDFNVAGLRKVYCKQTYPTGELLKILQKYQIPFVGGSDAHEIKHMALLQEMKNAQFNK